MSLLKRIERRDFLSIVLEYRDEVSALQAKLDWRDFLVAIRTYHKRGLNVTTRISKFNDAIAARHPRKWMIYNTSWYSIARHYMLMPLQIGTLVVFGLRVPSHLKVLKLPRLLSDMGERVTFSQNFSGTDFRAGLTIVGYAPNHQETERITTALQQARVPHYLMNYAGRYIGTRSNTTLWDIGLIDINRRGVRLTLRLAMKNVVDELPGVASFLRYVGLEDLDYQIIALDYVVRLRYSIPQPSARIKLEEVLRQQASQPGRVQRPWHKNMNINGETVETPRTHVALETSAGSSGVIQVQTPYPHLEIRLLNAWLEAFQVRSVRVMLNDPV